MTIRPVEYDLEGGIDTILDTLNARICNVDGDTEVTSLELGGPVAHIVFIRGLSKVFERVSGVANSNRDSSYG